MGLAPAAHVLFNKFMKYKIDFHSTSEINADACNSFNPQNPDWLNRDRFVLSNGHACMLQYALLHLFGYKVTMDDIKAFRVSSSRPPLGLEPHLTNVSVVDSR